MENIDIAGDDDAAWRQWPLLRETTLADLEGRFAALDEHASANEVLTWLDRSTAFYQEAKRLRDAVCAFAVVWIKANGALRYGDVCFTVGQNRVVHCVDVRETLHTALRVLGGDVDGVAALLSATAWKHGACNKVLPSDEFNRLFRTDVRSKLLENGDADADRLVRIDEWFVR